jgi:hypothetical protein
LPDLLCTLPWCAEWILLFRGIRGLCSLLPDSEFLVGLCLLFPPPDYAPWEDQYSPFLFRDSPPAQDSSPCLDFSPARGFSLFGNFSLLGILLLLSFLTFFGVRGLPLRTFGFLFFILRKSQTSQHNGEAPFPMLLKF